MPSDATHSTTDPPLQQLRTTTTSTNPFPHKTAAVLIAILAITLALVNPLRNALPRLLPHSLSSSTRNMSTTTISSTLNITKRPSVERGHADHSWLYTFHTFSFASHHDPRFESFGPLRVINEDRVAPSTGFGAHRHAEFLIWSYIVSGELEHKDSMGNLETLRRGEVQFTSAGTGIRHSEYNRNEHAETHFLQIWATPAVSGLTPNYVTRKFEDERKKDRLLRIMEAVERSNGGEEGPIALRADLSMSASILTPGKSVTHDLVAEGERKVYLHVVMTGRKQPASGGARIRIGEVELGEGDGAFVRGAQGPGKLVVESVGEKEAEFLLFDMGL